MRPKAEERQRARELRQQGVAIGEIAQRLNVSKGSVSAWVRDIQLTDSQKQAIEQVRQSAARGRGAQANKVKWREVRSESQEKGRDHARQGSPLFLMGCMLYWAEGAKTP